LVPAVGKIALLIASLCAHAFFALLFDAFCERLGVRRLASSDRHNGARIFQNSGQHSVRHLNVGRRIEQLLVIMLGDLVSTQPSVRWDGLTNKSSGLPRAILAHARLGLWVYSLRPRCPPFGRMTRHTWDSSRKAVPRACVVARAVFAVTATAMTNLCSQIHFWTTNFSYCIRFF